MPSKSMCKTHEYLNIWGIRGIFFPEIDILTSYSPDMVTLIDIFTIITIINDSKFWGLRCV